MRFSISEYCYKYHKFLGLNEIFVISQIENIKMTYKLVGKQQISKNLIKKNREK